MDIFSDERNAPLISIIMPAYNVESYIQSSVSSVLKQTYSNFELIIIDDGSIDKTLDYVESFSIMDKRVKLIKHQENKGVSAARNTGIEMAQGDWIAFLDCDDMWDKTKLEKQIRRAFDINGEFIFTGSSYIDREGKSLSGLLRVPFKIDFKMLLKQNVISCSSVLIKKSYLIKHKMDRDDLHEDFAVWLRILKDGIFAYGIDEPLLIYRIYKESKSGKKIKSAIMTFKVYRYVGLDLFECIYYWLYYLFKSILKYTKIK